MKIIVRIVFAAVIVGLLGLTAWLWTVNEKQKKSREAEINRLRPQVLQSPEVGGKSALGCPGVEKCQGKTKNIRIGGSQPSTGLAVETGTRQQPVRFARAVGALGAFTAVFAFSFFY